jgi:hypothetical protein
MWEGNGVVISENQNSGRERKHILFIKLIK